MKPDTSRAWRECLTHDATPALNKAGVTQRSVWITASFNEGTEYANVTPVQGHTAFADITRFPEANEKAATEARLQSMVT